MKIIMKMKIFASVFLVIGFASLLWMSNSGSSRVNAKTLSIVAAPDSAINWDKMDHDARMAYMKKMVMPTMRAEFMKFDSLHFAKMNCMTCHGTSVKKGSFKMPNPELPKLPNSQEGWKKVMDKNGDMLKFMKDHVKPDMANLLGMKPYDMKTKTGFGCGNCHTDQE